MLTAVLTLGVAMTIIAFLPPLPVILVLCAVVGFVYGPIAPIYNYVMQTRAPQHLRGRVVGVMGSLAYAAGPLGLILAGPLADAAGLHATFLALSLPMLVLGVAAVFLPALRRTRPAGRADGLAAPSTIGVTPALRYREQVDPCGFASDVNGRIAERRLREQSREVDRRSMDQPPVQQVVHERPVRIVDIEVADDRGATAAQDPVDPVEQPHDKTIDQVVDEADRVHEILIGDPEGVAPHGQSDDVGLDERDPFRHIEALRDGPSIGQRLIVDVQAGGGDVRAVRFAEDIEDLPGRPTGQAL